MLNENRCTIRVQNSWITGEKVTEKKLAEKTLLIFSVDAGDDKTATVTYLLDLKDIGDEGVSGETLSVVYEGCGGDKTNTQIQQSLL